METITMSRKEMSQLEWMEKVKRKELSLRSASSKMSLSYRQAKRLKKRFEAQGASGLVHGLRGKPSNRKADAGLRQRVPALFREKYHDFGATQSRFYPEETTAAAMDVFSRYVLKYGLPQALYVDHDSIYETSRKTSIKEALLGEMPPTQFGRAMKELGMQIIAANSPQAKGRVERRHGVMQDRLIKVMRLKKVNDIAGGNRLLEGGFLAKENLKFVKKAKRAEDGHRRVPPGVELPVVLSIQEERVVQSDWTVVCGLLNGTKQLQYQGHELKWKELPARTRQAHCEAAVSCDKFNCAVLQ